LSSSLYGASAEYALHSLLLLCGSAEPLSVRDLAHFQKLPERFLAKLFHRLKKAGLVVGSEGLLGGYALTRAPEQISVHDVLVAVDPNRGLFECAEIRRNCVLYGEEPPRWSTKGMCRIHAFMQEAEEQLARVLASKTLADLSTEFACKAPSRFLSASDDWFRQQRCGRAKHTSSHRSDPNSPHLETSHE
jgi:Rrf2 family protein